jgi:hypothetical protein
MRRADADSDSDSDSDGDSDANGDAGFCRSNPRHECCDPRSPFWRSLFG